MNRSILNIAHRGASAVFPENTLAAFRGAIEMGAHLCELDVQYTADHALVVIHDDTVDRTTDGTGAVANLMLTQLKRLDAGWLFRDKGRGGERISTLDEVFAATIGRCGLNIELKTIGCEREVAGLIRKWHAAETAMVSSFEYEALRTLHKIDSNVRLAVLAEKNPAEMLDEATRLHAYSVNPRFDMVTPELCARAHALGLKILPWTVDVPELMRLLIEYGVDGIMTDHPDLLRDVLSA